MNLTLADLRVELTKKAFSDLDQAEAPTYKRLPAPVPEWEIFAHSTDPTKAGTWEIHVDTPTAVSADDAFSLAAAVAEAARQALILNQTGRVFDVQASLDRSQPVPGDMVYVFRQHWRIHAGLASAMPYLSHAKPGERWGDDPKHICTFIGTFTVLVAYHDGVNRRLLLAESEARNLYSARPLIEDGEDG